MSTNATMWEDIAQVEREFAIEIITFEDEEGYFLFALFAPGKKVPMYVTDFDSLLHFIDCTSGYFNPKALPSELYARWMNV